MSIIAFCYSPNEEHLFANYASNVFIPNRKGASHDTSKTGQERQSVFATYPEDIKNIPYVGQFAKQ